MVGRGGFVDASSFGLEESVGVVLVLGPDGFCARRPMISASPPVGLAAAGLRRSVVVRRGSDLTLLPGGGGAPVALPSVTSLEAPPYSHPAIVGVASWTLVRDVTYAHHIKLDPQGE